MSKLYKLKEWLTVPETAKRLSSIFQEEVSEADVLRLALDGRLVLSIYFVNAISARVCKKVPWSQAKRVSALKFDRATGGPVAYSDDEEVVLGLRIDEDQVLEADKSFCIRGNGVFDLAMFGAELFEVERLWHALAGNPEMTDTSLDGIYLTLFGEGSFSVDGEWPRIYMLEDPTGRHSANSFPEDSFFVVGTKALRAFEQSVLDDQNARDGAEKYPVPTDRTLLKTIAALLAYFPPGKEPSGKDLERAAQTVGVSISDDTIRNVISNARAIAHGLSRA